MKRFIRYAMWALAGLMLAGFAFTGFVYWSLTHAFIEQTREPISREKALQHCPVALPASAHDIQYATYSCGLQDGEMWARFAAPVTDCHALAQSIFASRKKDLPGARVPQFFPVSHPFRTGSARLQTDWFDVDQIEKGVTAGRGESWEPQIWIDEERGLFYYHVTD